MNVESGVLRVKCWENMLAAPLHDSPDMTAPTGREGAKIENGKLKMENGRNKNNSPKR